MLIENAPYDRDVPASDFDEPVKSKYELKKTFITEAVLALAAELMQTPAIGYVNVNDGDVFQDIYPKRSMADSQSQKALGEIYFHKDLANHFVRPDQVYMVGVRSHAVNKVYTSFVRNIDVIAAFAAEELDLLKRREFYTPFDDLSVAGGKKELGEADMHAILGDRGDLRYFEKRTIGVTPAAKAIVLKVNQVLHDVKRRMFVKPGDLVLTYNNESLHSKEIIEIGDAELLKTRWIIKTVNVDDITPHRQHLVSGTSISSMAEDALLI